MVIRCHHTIPLLCLLAMNCLSVIVTRNTYVNARAESIKCGTRGGLTACPVADEAIWFMGPVLPVVPFFGIPSGETHELCYHGCVGLAIYNDLDVPVKFYLDSARLQQGSNEIKIASIQATQKGKSLDAQSSWAESLQVEPGDRLEIYFRGFQKGTANASLKNLRYCLPSFCKDLELDNLRIKKKWRIAFISINAGWETEI